MKQFFTLLMLFTAQFAWAQQAPMVMHYDRPADYFEESLPIGNGKIGALIYGGVADNIIYLNDITLWTGKPMDRQMDADAHRWIPKIREALFREDYAAADSLQLHVQGPNSQFFQPLATLHIEDLNQGSFSGYHRRLSLDSALVSDCYQKAGKTVRREYFASNPDRLIAVRMEGEALNLRLMLTGQTPHKAKASGQQITMTGHAMGDARESIHFCTILKVNTDGQVSASDSTLTISGARQATVYIVNETSFNGYDQHPVDNERPYLEEATNRIWHTQNLSYEQMRERHVADYRQYYDRVKLSFGPPSSQSLSPSSLLLPPNLPTDQLLRAYNDGGALATPANLRYLETLYFQYGRYLLIASSRTPAVPANLQGLWTPHLWSPWRGNYTVNINLEENYWPAFVSNLSEMSMPLDDFIRALAENGAYTARNYYGIQRGWCSSHNSDIWAMTNPVGEKNESPMWANWNMGGAWLVNTLWERYLFTQDKDYLRQTAWPLMKGAADFCLDWLIPNPLNPSELITAPSTSPENEYYTDKGYKGTTCYGGTADLAIIRELLTNTISAGLVCGESKARLKEYRDALSRLHPYTIGKEGDLNEWYHDWRDKDPHHRHQSHLIGLYPGNHLAPSSFLLSPSSFLLPPSSLLKACEQTLIQKGDQTTGWSTGWRINLWARLQRGDQAYHIYQKLLTLVTPDAYKGPDQRRSGGTYPNLMDAHPPFQIDGNFGGTAGVCEMLLQSQMTDDLSQTTIRLLPATPKEWSEGSVSGLRARGGYTLSMTWSNSQVTEFSIKSDCGGTVNVCYNGVQQTFRMKKGETLNRKL